MSKQYLTIATRESPLALWQANWVKKHLENAHSNLNIRLLGMTTSADSMLSLPLKEVGGKGLFVKELEEALLDKRADLAVHSMKDVPMELPAGLCLPVMCEREDPRDAFVSNQFYSFEEMPLQTKIGTSSLRRQSQLRALQPKAQIVSLRGNVNTRLKKLDSAEYDGLILAAAGLKRLGMEQRIRTFLAIDMMLPAPGQGVLGLECREDDFRIQEMIASLNHLPSQLCVVAERAMCGHLGGGCQTPVAAYAQINQDKLTLKGLVASADGTILLRAQAEAPLDQAQQLGIEVAHALLQQGAEQILKNAAK